VQAGSALKTQPARTDRVPHRTLPHSHPTCWPKEVPCGCGWDCYPSARQCWSHTELSQWNLLLPERAAHHQLVDTVHSEDFSDIQIFKYIYILEERLVFSKQKASNLVR